MRTLADKFARRDEQRQASQVQQQLVATYEAQIARLLAADKDVNHG